MANKELILDLGKLMIGAAWAGGQLQFEEINALKELLFQLPEISGEEWMHLEMYMIAPVSDQERQELLERVLGNIRSSADKTFVLETLEKLIAADGVLTNSERSFLETIRGDIDRKWPSLLSHFTGPIRHALRKRVSHYQGNLSREDRLEDYIKNTVYFQLVSEMKNQGKTINLPEPQIKKICLAAGLMARVAWVDHEFCDREIATIAHTLQQQWGLSEEEAIIVTNLSHTGIMKGLDLTRLTTGFCELASIDERKVFLQCLFTIANAAENTSSQEIEEIRAIAKGLNLPHSEFIKAKLTIPREDRKGL